MSDRLRGMACAERAAHPCIGIERAALVVAGCAVLDAIIAHKEAQAVEAMRMHLNTVFQDLERVRTEHGEYFVD